MPETIHKFPVPLEDWFELELPEDIEFCLFAEQNLRLFVWVRLDPDAPKRKWAFYVRGTGHPIPERGERRLKRIGSCLYQNGTFVWHLFVEDTLTIHSGEDAG